MAKFNRRIGNKVEKISPSTKSSKKMKRWSIEKLRIFEHLLSSHKI
jgi:hypothetical protein